MVKNSKQKDKELKGNTVRNLSSNKINMKQNRLAASQLDQLSNKRQRKINVSK